MLPFFPPSQFRANSNKGGWDRLTEAFPAEIAKEVDQAFDNVQHTLEHAGGKGWEQVYKARIYIVSGETASFEEIAGEVIRNLKKWCPNHQPLLTAVEVKRLYNDMKIEVEVEAHLG